MKKALSRPIHRPSRPSRERLDELAAAALAFLAQDEDRLSRFFAETGFAPADLRARAGSPDFAANLLDYLATDEATFVGFAHDADIDPAALDALRQSLARRP